VFHFDLKPENILASDSDFLIIDFGSANCQDKFEEKSIMSKTVSGNPI
jgi:serine/threonine protein kinase